MNMPKIKMVVEKGKITITGEPEVISKVRKTIRENLYHIEIDETKGKYGFVMDNQCSGCEFDFNDCKKEGRFKEDYSCRKPMGESL